MMCFATDKHLCGKIILHSSKTLCHTFHSTINHLPLYGSGSSTAVNVTEHYLTSHVLEIGGNFEHNRSYLAFHWG